MSSYQKTITDLVEYLNLCRDLYYNKNVSAITDEQYDSLFDKLKELEDESGIILANSPTQTVGYSVVSELKKVKHIKPLLSLDKTKNYSDVLKFCGDKECLFMYKCDGLTIDITYLDGKLLRAETRGDGIIGEDITHNVVTFIGVPKTIPYKGNIHVTGEAVINRNDFFRINDELNDMYKNPRNLVSGSVRQLDSSVCAKRSVRFICWNANDLSEDGTMESGLLNANNCGFTIVHYCKKKYEEKESKKEKESNVELIINNIRKRTSVDYIPIDGIVIMYNDIKYGESLGKTSHHFRNGLAFKFYDDTFKTKLKNIEFSIGKTGVLTPTAVFDPVEIDGTTIERASLHNISILRGLNLAIGDIIGVYKANQIIPQVAVNHIKHNDSNIFISIIPDKCPICGKDTEISISNDSGVEILICTNKQCSGKLLKKISSFVSRDAMDIRGLSEKTLEKFIQFGYIRAYHDIYTFIKRHYDEILSMDGFGQKSLDALQRSIDASRKTTLERFIYALNIDNLGKQMSITLSNFFDNSVSNMKHFVENIRHGDATIVSAQLLEIDGFGDQIIKSIIDWFLEDENYNEFQLLLKLITIKESSQKGKLLEGMEFVITGKLNNFKNRDELIKIITNNGGTVSGTVKKTTSYLINNDITSTSGKNKKAKELGIKIVDEAFIISLINKT